MWIDLTPVEWTQIAIAITTAAAAGAAWRSTVLQKGAQEQTAQHAAEEGRYRELADMFSRVVEVTGAVYGALVAYVGTGLADRGQLLSLFGRGAHVAGLVRLRYAVQEIPKPVDDALTDFAQILSEITEHVPPRWCPRKLYWWFCPMPDGLLQKLLTAHLTIADVARSELDKLAVGELPPDTVRSADAEAHAPE